MTEETKRMATARINRVAGQVSGIQRMIEEERYCVDVLHQIAAVRSALDQLGVQLLTAHIESCVVSADEERRPDLLNEVRRSLGQFLK